MYVDAHIKVYINNTQIYSIVSVDIENDAKSVGSSCELVMPLTARIEFNREVTSANIDDALQGYLTVPTAYSFNTGDHIVVKAKYDGYEDAKYGSDSDGYLKIFEGFLYEFYLSTPIKIKCLDFVYWFNLANFGDTRLCVKVGKKLNKTKSGIGVHYDSVSFKQLIMDLLDWVNSDINDWNDTYGTNYPSVTLTEKTFDTNLVDITFMSMSPAAVLEYFKREIGLCITFIGSQLYINVASNTTSVVKLDTGINVLKSEIQQNNLKKTSKTVKGVKSLFVRIKLTAYFVLPTGKRSSLTVGDEGGEIVNYYFYNVAPDAMTTSMDGVAVPNNFITLANEALESFRHGRFTGEVETPLYPYFDVFWKVIYNDLRYPEKNGNYVVTSMKIKINEHGYHRIAKLAWLDNQS